MTKYYLLILLMIPATMKAQINGRVVNENGQAIPFASISVKNTSKGTQTDSAGAFILPPADKFPFTIIASSSGYKSKELIIKNADAKDLRIVLDALFIRDTVVITSRRRAEVLQDVPIPISVLTAQQIDQAGAFNVNRVKEFIPSVQLYSSNPRNTGLNIRGLGSPFGLTNDGLDPGVGFYVDGVYYARPAAATLDFIDIERIEVLRGPQGTLFGKNTTSGAFNITTRKPTFKPSASFETSYGNYGYVQAKASVSGPLSRKLAGRLSFSGTQRDGVIENIRTLKYINDINNLGLRLQLLYQASEKLSITLSADNSRQRPDGYAQVVAGVVQTKRPAYRQFNAIIADLIYKLPSTNAFDRIVDHDSPWNSGNDLGGASINADLKLGSGVLTSTTAWRYWDWNPSNDRDFTGLQSLAKSNNYSRQRQWSEELRYAGEFSKKLSGVAGLFALGQTVQSDPVTIEEAGSATWRFQQSTTSALWRTPGLFEGFGVKTLQSIESLSAAFFANLDWELAPGLHVLPGIRLNYDEKDVIYDRKTYGGLDTATYNGSAADKATLQGFKNGVYSNQSYTANADEKNFTYQLTVAYRANQRINAFATYSTGFKPIGVNVGGLPTTNGAADLSLAVIKPEEVRHYEAGIKTNPTDRVTLNLTYHHSDIHHYQANVQSAELGVNRGYLANAQQVRVKGFELDGNARVGTHLSVYGALAYTDAKYVSFTNAPLPLEETGLTENGVQKAFKDISGGVLPGISKWAGSYGAEYSRPAAFFGDVKRWFVAVEGFARSGFSSSPSPSAFLNIPGYGLVNARLGIKAAKGLTSYVWVRNALDKDYYEQLLPAGGNAGHYAGVLGDPRTYGVTLRYEL